MASERFRGAQILQKFESGCPGPMQFRDGFYCTVLGSKLSGHAFQLIEDNLDLPCILSAPVAHQVRGARLYVRRPICVELIAEGLTCCHWSWTFQKTTRVSLLWFGFLSQCVCWRYGSLCNAPMTYSCNRRTTNLRMMMIEMSLKYVSTWLVDCNNHRFQLKNASQL